MNAIETNTRSSKKEISRPALEIRFYFADGSSETFIQPDAEAAEVIRQRADSSNLFNQSRIVVADDYSKSVFVCAQVNRVDLVFNGSGHSKIPPDHLDLVELTEAEFHQCVPVNDPDLLPRREHQRQVGDLLVSFLDLRMRGGSRVYLMNETHPQLLGSQITIVFVRLIVRGRVLSLEGNARRAGTDEPRG